MGLVAGILIVGVLFVEVRLEVVLAGFEVDNNSLAADVSSPASGTYDLAVRYANAVGGDGRHEARTLSLSVDGGADRTFTLPPTSDWNTWGVARLPLGAPA